METIGRCLPPESGNICTLFYTTEVFAADLRHCTLSDNTMTLQVGLRGGWSLNALPCVLEVRGGEPTIRRFTPLECLRLQGFDDDWL